MALLTPKDIRKHTFQTVRFKEGYDVDEVDDFLDQVTETIEALGKQAVEGAGQSTQSLGADVAALNGKIAELTTQLQSAKEENSQLKAGKDLQGGQASQSMRRSSPRPRRATGPCRRRTSSSSPRSSA